MSDKKIAIPQYTMRLSPLVATIIGAVNVFIIISLLMLPFTDIVVLALAGWSTVLFLWIFNYYIQKGIVMLSNELIRAHSALHIVAQQAKELQLKAEKKNESVHTELD